MMRRFCTGCTALLFCLIPRGVPAQPLATAVPPPGLDDDYAPRHVPRYGDPPRSPRDLKTLLFGFRLQIGGAIPVYISPDLRPAVGSSVFARLEFTMDIGPWVQIGAGVATGSNLNGSAFAAPSGSSGGNYSSAGPAYMQLRAHVYPLPLPQLGFFRPYLGLGVGYGTASATVSQYGCSNDFLFGRRCGENKTTLAAYQGADVEFTAGLRYDVRIRRAKVVREHFSAVWLIPLYAEFNYLKNFLSQAEGSGRAGSFDLLTLSAGAGMMF